MGKVKKADAALKSLNKEQKFSKKEKVKKIAKVSTPISRFAANRKIISKKEKLKLKKQKVLDGIKSTKKKFEEEKARIKVIKNLLNHLNSKLKDTK